MELRNRLSQARDLLKPNKRRLILWGVVTFPLAIGYVCDVAYPEPKRIPAPEIQTRDIGWGEAPEKFYEIGEHTAFLEIDGIPLESLTNGDISRIHCRIGKGPLCSDNGDSIENHYSTGP